MPSHSDPHSPGQPLTGQEQALFETLYQTYKRLMYATAGKYTDCPDEKDEIMQDAVERLLRRIPRLAELPERARGVYLVYTVRSAALDFQRRKGAAARHIVYTDFREEPPPSDPLLSPQDLVERKELGERLAQRWYRLEEGDRELLYRKYVLRESNEDIAAAILCKPASVRMKLTRAKRRAMELIKKEDLL